MRRRDSNRGPCDRQSGDVSTRPQHLYTSINELQYLESTLHTLYIICCYIVQALGKLSGCQEQPLFEKYAYNLNMLINWSIEVEAIAFMHSYERSNTVLTGEWCAAPFS